jgi:hypothetical protein
VALALVVTGILVGSSRPGRAAPPPLPGAPEAIDEQSEFEKGRNAYRARQYDEADTRFLRMLDPQHGTLHDRVLIRQARMYRAATLIAQHHDDEAAVLFELILDEDPNYEPDPLAFPTEVGSAFIDTRARLREALEAKQRELYRRAAERRANEEAKKQREAERIKMLEKQAGEAFVTQKHSRWTALLPFGVGQFQNGQRTAGWIFLAGEAALVAVGVATVPVYYVDLASAHDALPAGTAYTTTSASQAQAYLDRANATRYVNLSAYGALGLMAIIGAIQAEVAFVPEAVRIEPRALPELPPSVPPTGPPPRGASTLLSWPASFGAAPLPGRDARGVGGGAATLTLTF